MSTSYVRITDLSTGAVLVGGGTTGWTPVDSDSFDGAVADGLAAARASGAGSASFAVPLADSGVAVQVEAAAAAGHRLQVEVASYDDSGRLTSDTVLVQGRVTADQAVLLNNASAVQNLTLQATGYTTASYDPSTGAATSSSGYDFARMRAISNPAPSAPASDAGLAANADADAHSYATLDTFLLLTAQDGTVIRGESKADFSGRSAATALPASGNYLGDYQGELVAAQSVSYGLILNGAGSNTASLSYSAPADSISPTLFQALAKGTALRSAEIIQNGRSGSSGQVVADTVLQNLLVTGVTYQLDSSGDSRMFQFQAQAGTDRTSHENTSSAATSGSLSLAAPATVASGVAAPVVGNGATVLYIMTIGTGAGATSTAIDAAQFSVQRSGSSTAYSALTVTFNTAPTAATVAALMAAAGTALTIAQEKPAAGGTPFTFDTLSFRTSQAAAAPTVVDNGDGTSSYTYSFAIGSFQESYQEPPDQGTSMASSSNWNAVRASDGSSTLQESTACYCPGTLIATAAGEVPVERLVIGSLVVTPGGLRPVRWVGRRAYNRRFVQGKKHVLPVCIRAGALGQGLPRRDLWISPQHAMLIDGVLIEAKHLVNGRSVVQPMTAAGVEYYHVELEQHDVLLAEGTWSESFVDDESRGMFHNAAEFYALYSGTPTQGALYCAPRVESGWVLEDVRRRIGLVTTQVEQLTG